MIHPLEDGTFVISSHGQWLPGVYASRKAAHWAFQFADEDLVRLRDKVKGPITSEDIGRHIIVTLMPRDRGKPPAHPAEDGLMSCPCGRGDYGLCRHCPYDWCSVHGKARTPASQALREVQQACPRCGQDHKEPHCADGREWGPWPPAPAEVREGEQ